MAKAHEKYFCMIPKVCILKSDGTNCDVELAYAFDKFSAKCELVHVNQLRDKSKKIKDFQILALPGGFSYGDDIASGKVLAIELVSFLKEELQNFVDKKGIVVGICNGFQTLIRTGLLPFNHLGEMDATLAQNSSGHFECRWVKIKIEESKAVFLKPYVGQIIDIAINHGEGRFFAPETTIRKIEEQNLIFCRYTDEKGQQSQKYPVNPNGAIHAIAGVCDPTGRILGLMPHPEKIIEPTQHPNWRRNNISVKGGFIFEGIVNFVKQS